MVPLLRKIIAQNKGADRKKRVLSDADLETRETFLEEVKEIIELPTFNSNLVKKGAEASTQVPGIVIAELRDYITCIASMYRNNPFHSFEHASHVAMSTVKLLSRIVAPSEIETKFDRRLSSDNLQSSTDDKDYDGELIHDEYMATLHDHTFGITSDPLTQFACVFSALIHDGKCRSRICAFFLSEQ